MSSHYYILNGSVVVSATVMTILVASVKKFPTEVGDPCNAGSNCTEVGQSGDIASGPSPSCTTDVDRP